MSPLTPEQNKVLVRFLAIGLGIPLVLLAMELIIFFVVEESEMHWTGGTRWLIVAGLACVGLFCWAFFSQLLYRRLWEIYGYNPDAQDPWSFSEGVYGFVGVGIALNSVIGFFYYAINRDLGGSLVLFSLVIVLLGLELKRFIPRIKEIEMEMEERDGADPRL